MGEIGSFDASMKENPQHSLTSEEMLLLALEGLYPEQIAAVDQGAEVIGGRKLKRRADLLAHNAAHEALLSRWEALVQKGYWCIQCFQEGFPTLLREIPEIPYVLFGRGDSSVLETFAFAIVGTRNPSRYGEDSALRFAQALAARGATIVSGLAYGIDALAHRGALNARGRTIAVLGSGIDRIYPARHQVLAEEIVDKGGVLLSEFPPGMRPYPHHFLRRNRLISGLSRGVLVVEAGRRSGTMSTVKHAEEQNRDVFCIPGNIDQPRSEGTNGLIQQGAALVMDPWDIIHAFYDFPRRETTAQHEQTNALLTQYERELYDTIANHPTTAEALRRGFNMEASTLWSVLTLMEMKGRIWKAPDGRYHSYQKERDGEGSS